MLLSVVGWFIAEDVLRLLDTPEAILKDAVTYFRVIFLGMPFLLLFNFASAILRSNGDTKRPLYVLLCTSILNIGLNMLFVALLKMGGLWSGARHRDFYDFQFGGSGSVA